jgi:predicted MFS family arabinose efflux permease
MSVTIVMENGMPATSVVTGSSLSLMTAGSGLIAVTYGLIRFGYGLHLPAFVSEFALSPAMAGAIASGSFGGYCAAALLARRLITKGHARLTLWLAGGLAVSGSLGVAAAQSSTSLGVGVIVAGSAAGAASPALVAAVAANVDADGQERAQAVVNSGTGVGVVAAGLASAAMPEQWRGTWTGFAVASLLVTAAVDRRAAWPSRSTALSTAVEQPSDGLLRPAVLAAVLAGAGSAAVWTFGIELLTSTGGLPPPTTAVLWCLLGGAGVLGALSGDLVRACGLRLAWTFTATSMAGATVVLASQPSIAAIAATALVAFGGAYIALSGILIAWATRAVPQRAAEATATLFIALTAGQALGAFTLGVIAESSTLPAAFVTAAGLLLGSAATMRQPAPSASSKHPADAARTGVRSRGDFA